ncbi:hypothetical protein [Devosia nitrariae]|uniref:3-phosphoshikimate 1-carboxyvinyltransferase n=1 Tax=Devosia nitrariae TaxID=2071872 RepID=A0ABQ5W7Z9_9HYPH|nr:hypothetical protein [Devosia nitrariae]GLQ56013.1 3-phosphoshikimate 1-carboxyvinyltransferase [Devosia nitrariae]
MPIETAHPSAYRIERAAPLSGRLRVPGDRLAAHLALAAAVLAEGETVLEGLPQTPEFAASLAVVAALGPRVRAEGGRASIHGLGLRGLLAPVGIIDPGSGDLTAALGLGLAGILPMPTRWSPSGGRLPAALEAPLRAFGAMVEPHEDRTQPFLVGGPRVPAPVALRPAGEAEAFLAILACLVTPGISRLQLPADLASALAGPLRAFGADIALKGEGPERTLSVTGLTPLAARRFAVAGDPAEAAWAALAALIVPKSDVTIENVLVTPARTALIDALLEMGGNIEFANQREEAGEHIADLRVRSSFLRGTALPEARALGAGGLAALAVAGAYAKGETRLPATADFRILAAGLQEAGMDCVFENGTALITGRRTLAGGVELTARDARSALALAVLALGADRPTTVAFAGAGEEGWPPLLSSFSQIGARLEPIAPKEAS